MPPDAALVGHLRAPHIVPSACFPFRSLPIELGPLLRGDVLVTARALDELLQVRGRIAFEPLRESFRPGRCCASRRFLLWRRTALANPASIVIDPFPGEGERVFAADRRLGFADCYGRSPERARSRAHSGIEQRCQLLRFGSCRYDAALTTAAIATALQDQSSEIIPPLSPAPIYRE